MVALVLAPFLPGRRGSLAAQISPGPLAAPHADLEGTLKCTRCHEGGKDGMSAQCQRCHRDIAWLAAHNQGYHATADVKGTRCAACHPDHAGQSFDLIRWPDGSRERFDHTRAGWPLTGSHRDTPCGECHVAKFQVSPAAALRADKSHGGWTGLETTCTACHKDEHRGALGANCTRCHDTGKWTRTPGFDHDSTAYPLTDQHAKVACAKCHLAPRLALKRDPRGRPIPVYKPVPHQSCADCHNDPHAGRLGPTCTKCHTTRGFRVIDRKRFDHDRTRFPLQGKHAAVRCAECHGDFSTPRSKKPGFATCSACHKDAHGGTATLAGRVVDCAACHSVTGFDRAGFSVADHARTRYPLEGKHQRVPCGDCHRKETNRTRAAHWGTSRVILRPAFASCLDCHQQDHGTQLAGRTDRGNCAACHQVTGWTPSRFDRAAHAKLKLPLDGRHAEVPCRACHGTDRTGLPPFPASVSAGKARFVFHLTETTCVACHVDPHQGRFAAGGPRAKTGGCTACHDTRQFRPATVDVAAHRSFGFALEGAHRATPCTACHAEMKPPAAPRSSLIAARARIPALRFEAPTACADCHETPHGTQFASRKDHGQCDACHGVEAFVPASRFDHNRDAAFTLKGAHQSVPCDRCHAPDPTSASPGRRIYRPVSTKCESCHSGKEGR